MSISRISQQLSESNINVHAVIPLIEDVINIEKTSLQTQALFGLDKECLKTEIRITNAQILLSILHTHGNGTVR